MFSSDLHHACIAGFFSTNEFEHLNWTIINSQLQIYRLNMRSSLAL